MPVKVLFTVRPKDRNDVACAYEFEQLVPAIKKSMISKLGNGPYSIETGFDQASVLYPKRFMFDYKAEDHRLHQPKAVIDAFFVAIEVTGVCLSKYDLHVTVEWV